MTMPTQRIRALDPLVARTLSANVAITSLPDALRELLHNALDAGSTKVSVEIDLASLSVTITDNGSGIHPDDLISVGRGRHTSKENNGSTLGYRGESLAAIASSSNMSIVSKIDCYNAAYYTRWNNGKCVIEPRMIDEAEDLYQKRITSVSGTTIKIQQLFHNRPARLEQLRKIPEYKVLNEVRRLALECVVVKPMINLTIHKINRVDAVSHLIATVSGCNNPAKSWKRALHSVYGIDTTDKMVFFKIESDNTKLSCLMSSLPVTTKTYQFLSLNGPFVADEHLKQLINQELDRSGFGKEDEEVLISSLRRSDTSPRKGKNPTRTATTVGSTFGKHAMFIMKFETANPLDYRRSKNDESLSEHPAIKTLVSMWLYNFLRKLHGHPINTNSKEYPQPPGCENPKHINKVASNLAVKSRMRLGALREKELNGMLSLNTSDKENHEESRTAKQETIEQLIKRRRLIPETDSHPCLPTHEHYGLTLEQLQGTSIRRDLLSTCSVISQVDSKFILVKSSDEKGSLYLIDQHACDERIQVEAIIRSFHQNATTHDQELAVPIKGKPIDVSNDSSTMTLLRHFEPQLAIWGIRFVEDDAGHARLTHLPEIMHVKVDGDNTFISKCIIQFLHDLEGNLKLKTLPDHWWLSTQAMPKILIQLINSKACRSAIMFGDPLSRTDCQLLVRDLAQCKQPFQCAHGRPSIVPLCEISETFQ